MGSAQDGKPLRRYSGPMVTPFLWAKPSVSLLTTTRPVKRQVLPNCEYFDFDDDAKAD